MYQNYNVVITGGTSTGPYTIYYDVIDPSNIALTYLDYSAATNLTLSQMQSGVQVTVPDGTRYIIVYNQLCKTSQTIPVQDATITYNFCLEVDSDTLVQFISSGEYNGYESWTSNDSTYFAYYDTSINKWKVSGGTQSYTILNASTYPPLTGWYTVGGGSGNLISYSGNCGANSPSQLLSMTVTSNRPSCECDGVITVAPSGGVPPYLVSIDNGVTFNPNKTVFNNLCEGTYSVVVMDSVGTSIAQSVVLVNATQPTTYSVLLTTNIITITNTPTQLTRQYTTTVSVTPSLPVGVTLSLSLSHLNNFSASTSPTSAVLTTNTILNKNGSPQTIATTNTSNSTTINPYPGCQSQTMYLTTLTEGWVNITMVGADSLVFTTTTTIIKTIEECLVGQSVDLYNVDKVTISGCSCCTAIVAGK
jgi:hypothetical protein